MEWSWRAGVGDKEKERRKWQSRGQGNRKLEKSAFVPECSEIFVQWDKTYDVDYLYLWKEAWGPLENSNWSDSPLCSVFPIFWLVTHLLFPLLFSWFLLETQTPKIPKPTTDSFCLTFAAPSVVILIIPEEFSLKLPQWTLQSHATPLKSSDPAGPAPWPLDDSVTPSPDYSLSAGLKCAGNNQCSPSCPKDGSPLISG